MQHTFVLRQYPNAHVFLASYAEARRKLCCQQMPRVLRYVESSHLRGEFHGNLFCERLGSHIARPFDPVRARGIVPVTAVKSNNNPTKTDQTKVIKIILSVAVIAGVAILVKAGTALASSQLLMPSIRNPTSVLTSSGRQLLVSAWMGLVAGCLHTLTGPDHLAALAPLSVGRTKLESVAVGALWGCGHDAGQVIFGILFLLLKGKLQIEVIRTWGARVVGMTLVAIGITGVKEAQAAAMVPCLAGNLEGLASNGISDEPVSNGKRSKTLWATLATGVVHGLQPDALIMILPALALPSRFAGAAFLSMFLFGTVLSMSGYTAFIASCSSALQKRIPRITEHLAWGSSLLAILVGIGILAGELFGISIF